MPSSTMPRVRCSWYGTGRPIGAVGSPGGPTPCRLGSGWTIRLGAVGTSRGGIVVGKVRGGRPRRRPFLAPGPAPPSAVGGPERIPGAEAMGPVLGPDAVYRRSV